jgi:hypothetical protein
MHHNQIIAVLLKHGFGEGRLIANSKSGYCKRHRSHFVVFNAQVCSLGGRVLKQADLDLTLDGEKLTAAARAVGENLFVLYENDPSPFWKPGTIPVPRVLRDAVWWTRIYREDEDLFLPMNSGPLKRKRGRLRCSQGHWQTRAAYSVDLWENLAWGSGRNLSGAVVQVLGHPPGVLGRRRKMRFSPPKPPKPGVALCVLCFTTASDCWTMFGLVTVPPSRRSCMTTSSDRWIR